MTKKNFKVITAHRCMPRAQMNSMGEFINLHSHCWSHGNLELEGEGSKYAKSVNMIVLILNGEVTIHYLGCYGSNPFMDFHLVSTQVLLERPNLLGNQARSLSIEYRSLPLRRQSSRTGSRRMIKEVLIINTVKLTSTLRFINTTDNESLAHTMQQRLSLGALSPVLIESHTIADP